MQPKNNNDWQFQGGAPQSQQGEAGNSSSQTNNAPQQFYSAPADDQSQTPKDEESQISWTASDSIDHDKGIGWYALLILGGVVLVGIALFLLKDWFIASILVLLTVTVGVVGNRKPKLVQYIIDGSGIHVNEKLYTYDQFQAFAIVDEGGVPSIILIPTARLSPTLSLFFDEKDGEAIVDTLSTQLPLQEHKIDAVDRLSRKLRL